MFKSDIEIAQSVKAEPISVIAERAGIDAKYVEPYGSNKAKIDLSLLKDLADKPDGKLILVTAITPTPAGYRRSGRRSAQDRQERYGSSPRALPRPRFRR